MKIKRRRKRKIFAAILLTAVIFLCGCQLWKMSERYVREEQIKKKIDDYRPADIIVQTNKTNKTDKTKEESPSLMPESQVNQFITDLQNEVNKDIAGWINIPETNIDYPFVKAADNDYYLRRDIFGNYALAGTIFMDYRCDENFTGFNTIIYGHNMNNGSMFGDLALFGDGGFFEENRTGTIYLKDKTYTLEFFAYMITGEDDVIIYNQYAAPEEGGSEFLEYSEYFEYVERFARNYREPYKKNNIVTLSTCTYDGGARIVLLANITNYEIINKFKGGDN